MVLKLNHNPGEVVNVRGNFRMALDKGCIGRTLRDGDEWEPEVERAIFRWGDPGGLYLELGAHIGCFTLLAARRFKSVIAVEPNPHSFALLARNVVLNELNNVRLFRTAVGDTDGETYFYPVDGNAGSSHTLAEWRKNCTTVPLCRPQAILQGQKPQFIKMDMEGDEYKVLTACPELLEAQVIVTEFSPDQIRRQGGPDKDVFLDLLRDAGFTFPTPNGSAHYQNIVARRR